MPFLSGINRSQLKTIGGNVVALSVLNLLTLLSPLILIPFLMRVIGAEAYGKYILSWTILYYFVFFVNYGFDYSATRQVSIARDSKEKLSLIFSSVTMTRWIFLGFSFIVLLTLQFIPSLSGVLELSLLGFGMVIGQSLFPSWIYQGKEEMGFVTLINAICRLLPLLFVFLLVTSEDDLNKVMIFQSIGYLTGGVISFILPFFRYKVRFFVPRSEDIKGQIKEGFSLFLTTMGTMFYRESSIVILGFTTSNYALVGYFGLADKVLRSFQIITQPLSQALFPYFGRKFEKEKSSGLDKFRKVLMLYGTALVLLSLFLFIGCGWLMDLYIGTHATELVTDIRILSPVIIAGGLNYYMGMVGLVNMGEQKLFAAYVLSVGVLNLFLCTLLSIHWQDMGASIAVLASETLLCILILRAYLKKIRSFS